MTEECMMSAYPQAGKASRTARGAVPTSRHYSRHPLPGAATCHQQRCITQRETGDPDVCCGHDSFQVTGDGHGSQPLGSQQFSIQPPASWFQLPMPNGRFMNSRCPCPSPVTCLVASPYTQYSRIPPLHFCTGRRPICTFARYVCIPCPRVTVPTCPLLGFTPTNTSTPSPSPRYRVHNSA